MTERIGKVVLIEPEPPAACEFCGDVKELRPYGPRGESICFQCAMRDEAGTARRMAKMLFGEEDA